MTGLTLKFDGKTENIIKELLSGLDYDNLEFDISYWESYGYDEIVDGIDFNIMKDIPSELAKQRLMSSNHRIIPEFTELFIRRTGTMKKEIYYYKDFLESDYIISIINYDHRNIEICCKDENLLKTIKNNFLNSQLKNKRIKELENIDLDAVLQAWRQGKGIDE